MDKCRPRIYFSDTLKNKFTVSLVLFLLID